MSVSDKEVSADGWSRCMDGYSMPPELLKTFDHSLLEPQDKIPEGNDSCVAFMNYVYRTLQMMICEFDMFLARISNKPSYFLQCDVEEKPAGCVANDEYSKPARLVQGLEDFQA